MPITWLAAAAREVPPDDEWLSAGERRVLAALRVPKRRADWRLGRWTAKRAVAARLGADVAAIEIRAAASGAPRVFIDGREPGVSLSLSHSHGIAFCVVADGGAALGCDVEKVEPRSPAFLSDYFTTEEQAVVAASSPPLRDRLVTMLWTVKESVLKALEHGLRDDPLSIVVAPPVRRLSSGWSPVSARHASVAAFTGWTRTADGFVWTWLGTAELGQPFRN